MSVNPEILRLQESVPCADCPLVKVCEEYDKEFADRGIIDIELQFPISQNPIVEAGLDLETGTEITQESIEAMRRGDSVELPDSAERARIRHRFLKKRLVPRDVYNAYGLLKDKTARVYTFGCKKPYKRFKFFGKLGCNGLVLEEPAATRRYEIRARQLNELNRNT